MKYADKEELIGMADSLRYCLQEKAYEDAQQWCLQILNGLYGEARQQLALVHEVLNRVNK